MNKKYKRFKPKTVTGTRYRNMRGGFATPGSGRRPSFGITKGSLARPSKTNVNKRVARMLLNEALYSKNPAVTVGRSLTRMAVAKVAVDIGGTVYQKLTDGPAMSRLGKTGKSLAKSHSSTTGKRNDTSYIGKTYKTNFTVGKEPSSSIKMASKMNGSTKLNYFDSMVNNLSLLNRSTLTTHTGFNQRMLNWWNSDFWWSYEDLEGISEVSSGYTQSQRYWQKCLLLSKYFGVKYQMQNTNKYLSTTVKVSFLRQKKLDISPGDMMDGFFTTDIVTPIQGVGGMPVEYQLSARANTGLRGYVALDPQLGRMTKSEAWQNSFESVKTFSRKLEPGEIWEIDYKHLTGSGLDVSELGYASATGLISNQAAAFYYPVFEVVGPKVECVSTDPAIAATPQRYIGTAPGSLKLECKKYCEIVQGSQNPDTFKNAALGFQSFKWAYKVYSEPDASYTTTAKRFNVNYANIFDPNVPAGVGDGIYAIPVTVDVGVTYAGKELI